jgi:ubiquitin C-terminal hydrolase
MAELLGNVGVVLTGSTELFRYGVQTKISPNAKVLSRFESVQNEPGMFHPLPINLNNNEANTLENVLEQTYNSSENIENWEATNGIRVAAKRSQKITKLPAYMLFQICRFNWSGNKLLNHFDFPSTIDMSPYCVSGIGNETVMELYGIIVHCGVNINGGHYFALIRNEKGEWIKFNDNSIESVGENFIDGVNSERGETPYILLYRKATQSIQIVESES